VGVVDENLRGTLVLKSHLPAPYRIDGGPESIVINVEFIPGEPAEPAQHLDEYPLAEAAILGGRELAEVRQPKSRFENS